MRVTVQISDSLAKRMKNKTKVIKFDDEINSMDDALGFMISQLAYLEPEIYKNLYPDLFFRDLVPIKQIPEGSQMVTYKSFDGVTMGKFVGGSAKDLPAISASAEKHDVRIGYGGNIVRYSKEDIRSASYLGIALDTEEMELAIRGCFEHQQKVIFFGDAKRKMNGLLNHPNVTKSNSTVNWNSATPKEILKDINTFLTSIWKDSAQVCMPDTLLLDTERYGLIANTLLTENSDDTILDFLEKKCIATKRNGKPLKIVPLPFLDKDSLNAQGAGTKDMMVAYVNNMMFVRAYVAIAPRFMEPVKVHHFVEIATEYKISGTEFVYPQSAGYRTFDTAIS